MDSPAGTGDLGAPGQSSGRPVPAGWTRVRADAAPAEPGSVARAGPPGQRAAGGVDTDGDGRLSSVWSAGSWTTGLLLCRAPHGVGLAVIPWSLRGRARPVATLTGSLLGRRAAPQRLSFPGSGRSVQRPRGTASLRKTEGHRRKERKKETTWPCRASLVSEPQTRMRSVNLLWAADISRAVSQGMGPFKKLFIEEKVGEQKGPALGVSGPVFAF